MYIEGMKNTNGSAVVDGEQIEKEECKMTCREGAMYGKEGTLEEGI